MTFLIGFLARSSQIRDPMSLPDSIYLQAKQLFLHPLLEVIIR